MTHWVIRTDVYFTSPEIETDYFIEDSAGKYFGNDKDGYKLVLYTSPRRYLPERNDKIIFSEKGDKDYKFIASSAVLSEKPSTELLSSKDKSWKRKKSIFEITKPEEYPESRELSIFKYSIDSVYNYKRPDLHFRGLLKYLSDQDFETIDGGVIYWPRTLVGFLLHSFSSILANDFEKFCLRHGVELKSNKVDYLKVAKLISTYFDISHISLANSLNHLETLISGFNKKELQNISLSTHNSDHGSFIPLKKYFSLSESITAWLKQNEIKSMTTFFEKGFESKQHIEYEKIWQPLI